MVVDYSLVLSFILSKYQAFLGIIPTLIITSTPSLLIAIFDE
jgi:hypothetical protein